MQFFEKIKGTKKLILFLNYLLVIDIKWLKCVDSKLIILKSNFFINNKESLLNFAYIN
jgi:hypothetical protein